MTASFFTLDGFFLSWKDKSGECRVFTRDKRQADDLFVKLKKDKPEVEKWRIQNGKMKKIA